MRYVRLRRPVSIARRLTSLSNSNGAVLIQSKVQLAAQPVDQDGSRTQNKLYNFSKFQQLRQFLSCHYTLKDISRTLKASTSFPRTGSHYVRLSRLKMPPN